MTLFQSGGDGDLWCGGRLRERWGDRRLATPGDIPWSSNCWASGDTGGVSGAKLVRGARLGMDGAVGGLGGMGGIGGTGGNGGRGGRAPGDIGGTGGTKLLWGAK